jgi:hypothetical protein
LRGKGHLHPLAGIRQQIADIRDGLSLPISSFEDQGELVTEAPNVILGN